MGVIVLVGIAILCIMLLNSGFFSRSSVEESPDIETAKRFCSSVVNNAAVVSMSKKIFEYVKGKILFSVKFSDMNQQTESLSLHVCDRIVFLDDKAAGFTDCRYIDYGIQRLDAPYKVHGLALAFRELIAAQFQGCSIPNVKSISIKAIPGTTVKGIPSSYLTTLKFNWSISQTKFIEL